MKRYFIEFLEIIGAILIYIYIIAPYCDSIIHFIIITIGIGLSCIYVLYKKRRDDQKEKYPPNT
jgi:hypothetical protein